MNSKEGVSPINDEPIIVNASVSNTEKIFLPAPATPIDSKGETSIHDKGIEIKVEQTISKSLQKTLSELKVIEDSTNDIISSVASDTTLKNEPVNEQDNITGNRKDLSIETCESQERVTKNEEEDDELVILRNLLNAEEEKDGAKLIQAQSQFLRSPASIKSTSNTTAAEAGGASSNSDELGEERMNDLLKASMSTTTDILHSPPPPPPDEVFPSPPQSPIPSKHKGQTPPKAKKVGSNTTSTSGSSSLPLLTPKQKELGCNVLRNILDMLNQTKFEDEQAEDIHHQEEGESTAEDVSRNAQEEDFPLLGSEYERNLLREMLQSIHSNMHCILFASHVGGVKMKWWCLACLRARRYRLQRGIDLLINYSKWKNEEAQQKVFNFSAQSVASHGPHKKQNKETSKIVTKNSTDSNTDNDDDTVTDDEENTNQEYTLLTSQMASGFLYYLGENRYCKNGRGIIWVTASKHEPQKYDSKAVARAFHHVLYTALRQDSRLQIAGFTVVVDLTGMKRRHFDRHVFEDLFQMLNSRFPMRYGKLCIFNPPTSFSILYKIVSLFMTRKMKDRIQKMGKNPTELHTLIDPEHLPVAYGGSLSLSQDVLQAWASSFVSQLVDWEVIAGEDGRTRGWDFEIQV